LEVLHASPLNRGDCAIPQHEYSADSALASRAVLTLGHPDAAAVKILACHAVGSNLQAS
jgi:hypothetical protein